ncbi:TAXI family TRAP transporter solute-binding subunit [Methylobacterium nigriterrae]|uniref:TAXI family TRAP transporter solute-binding subunit n=1 Tax=Methylobacterium nigriterrae TaxID=3127512 RepID=UPI0030136802
MVVRVLAGLLALIGLVAAILYFGIVHADLRITAGPPGSAMQRLVAALVAANAKVHPRVRLSPVEEDSLAASARALEEGRVDLAVIRSDLAPPRNAQTIAILRRDVVALLLPPHSPVDGLGRLAGRTVAIPEGPAQADNARILDTLLGYVDVPATSVGRIVLPVAEIGRAVHEKRAAAVLAVGPIGPGTALDAVAALAKAERGAPTLLAIDEAEAIGKRFPGFESIEVPAGAFRGRPEVPDDSVTSVAVTYRLVASRSMPDLLAAAIARSVFTMKPMLLAATPLASQIEAPDTDDKNPVLPIHPGVIAYLGSGDQSFFDASENYLYVGGIVLSVAGSALAILAERWQRRRSARDRKLLRRLIAIAEAAETAGATELDALDRELHALTAAALALHAEGRVRSDQWAVVAAAGAHARRAIAGRRTAQARAARAPTGTVL